MNKQTNKQKPKESKKWMDRQIENNEKTVKSPNLCELTSFEAVVLTNKLKFSPHLILTKRLSNSLKFTSEYT